MTTICIHRENHIDWDLIFNGISAVGTIGAFVFAIIIAANISFKKDLRRKQLDTVFEFVTHLQNLQLYLSYSIDKENKDIQEGWAGDVWFNFFDMTMKTFKNREDFQNGSPTVFVSEKFLYENEIFKYMHNPFLPKSIASKLLNLYPRGGNQVQYELKKNQVYISDNRNYSEHTYRQEVSNYYLTIEKVFESTESLNKSIRDWLKKNGADELNFRDKPINLRNYP